MKGRFSLADFGKGTNQRIRSPLNILFVPSAILVMGFLVGIPH